MNESTARHSFATSYLHAGGRVEDLSRILGHADIVTTYRRYVRPTAADMADGVGSVIPYLPDSIH
jgi:site-specific recombinase XerD